MISLTLLACLMTLIGCGPPGVPVSDVDAARNLLDTSLQAWKAGRTVEQLRQEKPPIYVADDLWNQGVELTDYTIASDGELYGSNVRLQVKLNGLRKDGETIAQQVKYLVTTTPALTIAREDR